MAHPKQLQIKESVSELMFLQINQPLLIVKRLLVLIVIKMHESTGISKNALSLQTGVNHNSIVKWRKMYQEGGIEKLIVHGRKGPKSKLFTAEEHEQLSSHLHNPSNGINGYKELLAWVNRTMNKQLKYSTLVGYVKKHFGTKIKVGRKSHIKKEEKAVEAFKKTLVKTVRS